MALNDLLKFGTIEQIPLLYGDAIPKRLEPLWRANEGGYGMTSFDCLPDDFESRAARGTQHNQLHGDPRFTSL
jgi:hypothetical protein